MQLRKPGLREKPVLGEKPVVGEKPEIRKSLEIGKSGDSGSDLVIGNSGVVDVRSNTLSQTVQPSCRVNLECFVASSGSVNTSAALLVVSIYSIENLFLRRHFLT